MNILVNSVVVANTLCFFRLVILWTKQSNQKEVTSEQMADLMTWAMLTVALMALWLTLRFPPTNWLDMIPPSIVVTMLIIFYVGVKVCLKNRRPGSQ